MLQRVIAAVLVVLGGLTAGLAVASATVWRPDDVVTAATSGDHLATLVVLEPGVLDLVSSDVTVTASRADGGDVVVALGREVDVRGWVGGDAHVTVTGLASWDALATTFVAGTTTSVEPPEDADGEAEASDDATPAPEEVPAVVGTSGIVGPDPASSDMWFTAAGGAGSATLTSTGEIGREMVLVASVGEGAPLPTVTLAWEREVTTPLLAPGIIVGVMLLVVGLGLLVLPARGRLATVRGRASRSVLAPVARAAAALAARRPGTPQPPPGETPASTGATTRVPSSTDATGTSGARTPDPTISPTPAPAAGAAATGTPAGPAGWGGSPYDRGPYAVPTSPATAAGRDTGRPSASPYAPAANVTPGGTPAGVGSGTAPAGASPAAIPSRPAASPYAASAPGAAGASDAAPSAARPMTRREMREQAEREAAAAALEKSRRRPRTGTLPVVRAERTGTTAASAPASAAPSPAAAAPAAAVAPQAGPPPAVPTDDAVTARADAWRRAWGFEQQGWQPDGSPSPSPEEEA